MSPRLKVAYSDFWPNFDPENNFFAQLLRKRFSVVVSTDPDLLICSTFGNNWAHYSCPRVLFTGENFPPDGRVFDASFSFRPTSETNYYLPLYRLYEAYPLAFRERTIDKDRWANRRQIGIVFSNSASRFRTSAFHRLSRIFDVGSGGRAFNNVGGPVADKAQFLKDYNLSVAFENASWPGYTTEKLLESYVSGTIPLYWGDPEVGAVFNERSFLSLRGTKDLLRLERDLTRVLSDFDAYQATFREPLFPQNQEPAFLKEEPLADFLEQVASRGLRRTAKGKASRYQVFQWSREWDYRVEHPSQWIWSRVRRFFEPLVFLGQVAKDGLKRLVRRGQ